MKEQQNAAADALGPQGFAVALVSLSSLIFVSVGMGLKLLKFRRQMRLGRFSQATAATSAKMDMAASMTNVPSQGVFRMWNISEEGPPDPPPRVRPKTMEAVKPAEKQARPKSLPVTEMGVDVPETKVKALDSSKPVEVGVDLPSASGTTSKTKPKDTSKAVQEVGVDLPSLPLTPSKTKTKKEKVDKKSRPKSVDTPVAEVGVDLPSLPVTPSKTKLKKEKVDKKSKPKTVDTPENVAEPKTKGKKEKVDKKSRPKSLDTLVTTAENAATSKSKGKKEKVDKKSRPKSVDPSLMTSEVPKSKGKKTKAAPPSRRNPNAPSFARNSIITNVPSTPPPTAMNHVLIKTNPEVSNGNVPAPRSPVMIKSKMPKKSSNKRPVSLPPLDARQPTIVPHKSPGAATSPVPVVTSPADFEETGVFTFQSHSPEPYDMPPSFLYGGVNDDEECDA